MALNEVERIAGELVKGKSDIKAYQAIKGCSYEVAHANASKYMQAHPQIKQKAIDLLMKREDLTIDKALDAIERGLGASNQGKFGTHTEYATQLESAKLLLRLYGELKEDSHTLIDNRSVNITLTPEYIDRVTDVIQRFKEMKSKPSIIDGEIVRTKPKDTSIDV